MIRDRHFQSQPRSEWAIVFRKDLPYVVAVLENYGLEDAITIAMNDFSRTFYDYFFRPARATPQGTYVEKSK